MKASLQYKKNNYALTTDKDGQCQVTVWAMGADNLAVHGTFLSGHSDATGTEADSFSLNLKEADARRLAEAILQAVNATGPARLVQISIGPGGA